MSVNQPMQRFWEVGVGDTNGVELRIVRAVQIVDHIAAVLAAVEQSGPYQIAYSSDEERVLTSLYAVALSILDEVFSSARCAAAD